MKCTKIYDRTVAGSVLTVNKNQEWPIPKARTQQKGSTSDSEDGMLAICTKLASQ